MSKDIYPIDEDYIDGWTEMMTTIWKERLIKMDAIDTGALRESVAHSGTHSSGSGATISFDYLEYGIYVDAGTGKGYAKGNGGDLKFLSATHRHKHKLGKAREKKRWFSTSWSISRKVLADHLAQQMGNKFIALFADL